MPWSAKDAKKFKKDITPQQEHQWASVANRVLSQTGSDKQAIKAANAATKGAIERRLRQKSTGTRTKGY